MATIKSFDELGVWKLSRELCKDIYFLIQNSELKNSSRLKNQIDGSSGSIMDNIAEGFERGGTKEFIQFLGYAKGSCGETRSQLFRCFDRGYMDEDKKNELINKTIIVSKQINGFMTYLKSSDIKGYKFKEDKGIYKIM